MNSNRFNIFSFWRTLAQHLSRAQKSNTEVLTLGHLSRPARTSPLSVIDEALIATGNRRPEIKAKLNAIVDKASNNAHILFVDASQLPHYWPLAYYAKKYGDFPPSRTLPLIEQKQILQTFRTALYRYCDHPNTLAAFENHLTAAGALDLMLPRRRYKLVGPGSTIALGSFSRRQDETNHAREKDQSRLGLVALLPGDILQSRFVPLRLAEKIASGVKTANNIFMLAHEAKHIGVDKKEVKRSYVSAWVNDLSMCLIPTKDLSEFEAIERRRITECASDLTGASALEETLGAEIALPHIKLIAYTRLCEAFWTGTHTHLTAPVLFPRIWEHDKKMKACTQRVVGLTPAELYLAIRECRKILPRISPHQTDLHAAAEAARLEPSRILLRTAHILKGKIEDCTI